MTKKYMILSLLFSFTITSVKVANTGNTPFTTKKESEEALRRKTARAKTALSLTPTALLSLLPFSANKELKEKTTKYFGLAYDFYYAVGGNTHDDKVNALELFEKILALNPNESPMLVENFEDRRAALLKDLADVDFFKSLKEISSVNDGDEIVTPGAKKLQDAKKFKDMKIIFKSNKQIGKPNKQ